MLTLINCDSLKMTSTHVYVNGSRTDRWYRRNDFICLPDLNPGDRVQVLGLEPSEYAV